jgi:molecular chaperone GrpE
MSSIPEDQFSGVGAEQDPTPTEDVADAAPSVEAAPSAEEETAAAPAAAEQIEAPAPSAEDETAAATALEEETAGGTEDELASEIEAEIAELAAQRDQYKDIAQRVQADFENYRKRVQQQVRDEADRASSKLAAALLPVLDAAESAYLGHPDEVGPLLNVMLSELRKQGLETLHLQDQPFDPNVAEAVAHEPGDGGEVVVAEVLRSGYTWNGRTLRPAMVRTRD